MSFTRIAFIGGASLVLGAAFSSPQNSLPANGIGQRAMGILQRCAVCHRGGNPAGGLNLSSREAALKGGVSGVVLLPKEPEKSLLFQKVVAGKMPPEKPLTPEEVATLKGWVLQGAEWQVITPRPPQVPNSPLFRPLSLPKPSSVRQKIWVRSPLDAFVLAELEKQGLSPAPPADRRTLLRRVTLDLLGVPPTPAEAEAFALDPSPKAYERVVDRLLADPRYGERWARRWLDVVRFGESHGFERDQIRPNAWHYRDYVIRAFNQDKPYPLFVKEQIAGDLMEPTTQEGIIGTGFLVAAPWDEVGQSQVSQVMRGRTREEELEEMLGTVGQTFLGLTVNCARCHDHKFDPIPQRDYYRMKAALSGVWHGERPLFQAQEQERIRLLEAQMKEVHRQLSLLEGEANKRGENTHTELPSPRAQWTFEAGTNDLRGELHGSLKGGAEIANGRLLLNGRGAFLETTPLNFDLRAKTFEVWATLATLEQRGGGVLSLIADKGRIFDSVVFGERQARKWMAGSDFFRRTRDLDAPPEAAAPEALVHLVVVYSADNRIVLFRNGKPYGEAYLPTGESASLRLFPKSETRVLLGLRHPDAGNGYFAGAIEEARLYDRALTLEEVMGLFRAGVSQASGWEKRLTAEEQGAWKRLQRQSQEIRGSLSRAKMPSRTYAATPRPTTPTFLLVRGDVENPSEEVTPAGLSVLPNAEWGLTSEASEATRRLRLADWIASRENPIFWRVMANRIWERHFGRGIVATPNDFGKMGEAPTHPQLLDWLAKTFQRSGGSVKALERQILLSNTYRQSARFNSLAAKQDADNRTLWRFTPRRLEGEAIRDSVLAVSGKINYKMGGESFQPFIVTINNSHFYSLFDSDAPEFCRRSIYRMNVHSAKSPFLDALDCPDPSTKTPRRMVTTTPLQALELMNNAFVLKQSKHFAARLQAEAGATVETQVLLAYRLAYGRPPTGKEAVKAHAFVRLNRLESLCWALFNSSEFIYMP